MEKIMLNTLKFNLTVPTSHNFLTRYLKVRNAAVSSVHFYTLMQDLHSGALIADVPHDRRQRLCVDALPCTQTS